MMEDESDEKLLFEVVRNGNLIGYRNKDESMDWVSLLHTLKQLMACLISESANINEVDLESRGREIGAMIMKDVKYLLEAKKKQN